MTTYKTAYGNVYGDGPCKDNYRNIHEHSMFLGPNHQTRRPIAIKLQDPAWISLRKCEDILKHQIMTTGSWRSCSYQHALYARDPFRYADPDVTLHTRGLAIDVNMNIEDLNDVTRLLLNHGWHRVRSDEPWHFSFRLIA